MSNLSNNTTSFFSDYSQNSAYEKLSPSLVAFTICCVGLTGLVLRKTNPLKFLTFSAKSTPRCEDSWNKRWLHSLILGLAVQEVLDFSGVVPYKPNFDLENEPPIPYYRQNYIRDYVYTVTMGNYSLFNLWNLGLMERQRSRN